MPEEKTRSGCIDIDDNLYKTVKLGNQIWMAENLKVAHYNNGDEIPCVANKKQWKNLSSGALANHHGENFYNWYVISEKRNLSPRGWHIPSDNDIKELELYLGINQNEKDMMNKEIGGAANVGSKLANDKELWNNGKLIENKDFGLSGFNALPFGSRGWEGDFEGIGKWMMFWTSTNMHLDELSGNSWDDPETPKEIVSNNARGRIIGTWSSGINRGTWDKRIGMSIRCLKD